MHGWFNFIYNIEIEYVGLLCRIAFGIRILYIECDKNMAIICKLDMIIDFYWKSF